MGSSMLEQLKKAGLVDENRANKVKHQKYKKQKQQKGKRKNSEELDLAKAYAEKARQEKIERDRELNRQRQEREQRKAIAAQIKQMVEENRIRKRDGEMAYNFSAGTKIKRIYLSEEAHKKVTSGEWCVVNCNGRYELLPATFADKVRARDEKAVVVDNRRAASTPETRDEDDPYADFEVPDDLMW